MTHEIDLTLDFEPSLVPMPPSGNDPRVQRRRERRRRLDAASAVHYGPCSSCDTWTRKQSKDPAMCPHCLGRLKARLEQFTAR